MLLIGEAVEARAAADCAGDCEWAGQSGGDCQSRSGWRRIFECVFRPGSVLGGSDTGKYRGKEREDSTQRLRDRREERKNTARGGCRRKTRKSHRRTYEHQSQQSSAHRARAECGACDTMVRILRHVGNRVQIQNYIDNTGVQVADVVIGFLHMEQRTPIGVKMMSQEPKFDYYCWDLYAKATSFFAEDKARAEKLRGETLRAIEEGKGEDAEVAQVVADAIVGCHLRTMARLGIGYELLARESEILHLHFWDAAFAMLKKSGAFQLATGGKMAGWGVMPLEEEIGRASCRGR